ncbi:hypothetical protein RO3G_16232 [Rhizopus delemar RA 99-880]|uniref:Tc1-like transposase DDE domain-containing protein n=1 Tax=Rhizopus delemar (strain RA 99-880 / ATCC MYA-4621 / FGSC 9543 / NRRL 43880) TaxID=246409 RepID=I1CSU1_RHIO9|nr:hypothetical protein RO3G_16232 [Rhizopus delemar RA 99-880]|eukprot:EIE91521.1 hypothetical protein RO3G_16232 [Rhizopus delemar RA 99-880]
MPEANKKKRLCVVELTFRKPKAVQKKTSGTKKRKKDTGKADEAEVNARVDSRGYKAAYLPPYSPFLNPIELFWSKIKGNIRKDCLGADDNLRLRITETANKATQQYCANWISHSQSFFDGCLVLEPTL